MALVRWSQNRDPWMEMRRVQEEMDRMFRGYFGQGERGTSLSGGLFPSMNISTDDKAVTVRYEMPGVPMDKIDLSINRDTLTIKGERALHKTGGEVSFHRRERRGGVFNRTVNLPYEVDPERARASYRNGLLEVVIERAEKTRPRQISIKGV